MTTDSNATSGTSSTITLTNPDGGSGSFPLNGVSSKKKNAYYYMQMAETGKNKVTMITRGAFKDTTADPTVPHLIQFSPFGINHVFAAGNLIKFYIASRDYPFFLPNLNQPTAPSQSIATPPIHRPCSCQWCRRTSSKTRFL